MGKAPKEVIVYQGPCFAIEWFYKESGTSESLEYYDALPDDRRRKLLVLAKRIGDTGQIFDKTKFRYEGDKIYSFKPQPDRFLCFFTHGRKIIITGAFEKKSQKFPRREKEKALNAMKSYEERVRKGIYYENL